MLLPPANEVCVKVILSLVSVCSQREWGPHVTIIHDVLDLTVQPPRHHTWDPPALLHQTSDMGPRPAPTSDILRATSGKHIKLASGRYASYWNAFFFGRFYLNHN